MSIFDDLAKEKRNQGINSLLGLKGANATPYNLTFPNTPTPKAPAQIATAPRVPLGNVPIATTPKLPPAPQYDYSQYSIAKDINPATRGRDIAKGGVVQKYEDMLPSFQAGFDVANIKNVYQAPAPIIPEAPVSETPTIPEPPKVDYLSELQKRILASLTPTSEESTLATQYADTDKQLADLIASKELGISAEEDRPIPMGFITGRQASIRRQAGLQALPLQAQLANIQAKRNIEADKRKAAMDVATTQMSFEEKRQEREEKLKEAEAKKLEGFNLSEGQVRYAYDPTTKSYKKVAGIEKPQSITEKYGTGTVGEYNYYAEQEKMAGKTPMSFNEYQTATKFVDINGKKYQINADGSLSEPQVPTSVSKDEITQMEKSKLQLSFLIDTANKAMSYSAASGRSGARKLFEAYAVGSTDYTNLESQANTLKTNLLALTTDPNVKKFFGPQMSEADVRMMMAGGTTLNPELQSPKDFYDETVRVKNLLLRMEDAVKKGLESVKNQAGDSKGNIITAPDGTQIEIIDDQQSFNSGSGGTPIATKDVRKIASAIKTVESGGNYQARGASGEYGAYQFMPGTWTSWAKTYLGDANAPMTPSNQEKVALSRIQELVNQGYNAHQIALIWNGGSPTIKKGVNLKGVAYDTGAYAAKVLKNLG